MHFRDALPNEAAALTQLALASKRYWKYPEEWIEIWTDDLTISSEYIEKNMVVVAEGGTELLGFVSITNDDSKYYLDNLFIHPSHIRKSIGEKLVGIALDWCRQKQIKQLHLYSDPHSKGFYEKTGAVYIGEIASSSIARRTLPLMTYHLQ